MCPKIVAFILFLFGIFVALTFILAILVIFNKSNETVSLVLLMLAIVFAFLTALVTTYSIYRSKNDDDDNKL